MSENYYFSPSTRGFYLLSKHGDKMPSDVKAVSVGRHTELQAGLASAVTPMEIDSDENGDPILVNAPPPSAEYLWAEHQRAARAALDASDITLLRCVEHAIAIPTAWSTYRGDLRAILSASSGDYSAPLPMRPSYPAGT